MSQYIFDSSAHGIMTLGGVQFASDPIWEDRFKSSGRAGSVHQLIGGSAVVQVFPKALTGQPITLRFSGDPGAITPANVASLKALCDAGNAINFYDGTQMISVLFDYTKEQPIDMEYFDENQILCVGTIYLIRA